MQMKTVRICLLNKLPNKLVIGHNAQTTRVTGHNTQTTRATGHNTQTTRTMSVDIGKFIKALKISCAVA